MAYCFNYSKIADYYAYASPEMQELMEEKLPIIYTNAIQYDPLINVDYTEEFTRNIDSEGQNSGSSNSNSKNNGSGLTVNSDTPQGEINKTKILNGEYASSTTASESENEITDSTETSGEATNSTLERADEYAVLL